MQSLSALIRNDYKDNKMLRNQSPATWIFVVDFLWVSYKRVSFCHTRACFSTLVLLQETYARFKNKLTNKINNATNTNKFVLKKLFSPIYL